MRVFAFLYHPDCRQSRAFPSTDPMQHIFPKIDMWQNAQNSVLKSVIITIEKDGKIKYNMLILKKDGRFHEQIPRGI